MFKKNSIPTWGDREIWTECVEAGSLLANKFGEEAKAKRHEAAIALEEAEKAKAENNNRKFNQALVEQARDNFETASREAKEWETGGSQRLVIDSALNVISTALAGRPAAEVVAQDYHLRWIIKLRKRQQMQKAMWIRLSIWLLMHFWGAVEAYAGNRNVAAGAAGAAGGEAAHFLASTLYDKSPEKLSEKKNVRYLL